MVWRTSVLVGAVLVKNNLKSRTVNEKLSVGPRIIPYTYHNKTTPYTAFAHCHDIAKQPLVLPRGWALGRGSGLGLWALGSGPRTARAAAAAAPRSWTAETPASVAPPMSTAGVATAWWTRPPGGAGGVFTQVELASINSYVLGAPH